jgi:lipopolysaccharide/colanic/teichoic acid biosynthesis glycosyltransferase
MKRLFDVILAACGLIALAPLFAIILVLVWCQDWANPLYFGERVGRNSRLFRMVKIRSMVVNADKTGVESTGSTDSRITPIGQFIRNWKLDEVSQLWNVLMGDMSLVGPRPNTVNGVSVYTANERHLLSARPGITDLSSIIFSDEGEILKESEDPDADYDRLIRPWKSRLSLLYVENASVSLDARLIWLTVVAVFDKRRALDGVVRILTTLNAPVDLIQVARRDVSLDIVGTQA